MTQRRIVSDFYQFVHQIKYDRTANARNLKANVKHNADFAKAYRPEDKPSLRTAFVKQAIDTEDQLETGDPSDFRLNLTNDSTSSATFDFLASERAMPTSVGV